MRLHWIPKARAIAGVINVTQITLGPLRSAYLGYYAFAGFERRGYLRAGLRAVIRHAFRTLRLHRLEANIQPGNQASIALVKACSFSKEGFSPRYLKIGGRWRDHERWAIVARREGVPVRRHGATQTRDAMLATEGGSRMDGCRTLTTVLAICATSAVAATEVAICTDQGRAVLELADEQSPQHVANFLRYVDMGFYTGTVFHRAVPGFVVQGGGVDRQLRPRSTLEPVPNESANGLSNARGTVAAARTDDPNTATAQFFVNLEDNSQLDAGREPGFTVFGRVKEGIAMFDALSRLPTGAAGPFRADVPTPLVAIRSIARLDEAALAAWPAEGRESALKSEIAAAAAEQRSADALRLIGHYRAICGADDPELALTEVRMALAGDDRRRALFALEELLATTDAAHPAREAANELYREALPEAQVAGGQRVGACQPPEPPTLPDATTASRDDMVTAQRQVREFVASAESHLTCLAQIIDDDERSADDRNAAVSEHNRTVAVMEQVASAFNEQVRIFRARG